MSFLDDIKRRLFGEGEGKAGILKALEAQGVYQGVSQYLKNATWAQIDEFYRRQVCAGSFDIAPRDTDVYAPSHRITNICTNDLTIDLSTPELEKAHADMVDAMRITIYALTRNAFMDSDIIRNTMPPVIGGRADSFAIEIDDGDFLPGEFDIEID